jgi:acyl-CoA synthetase (AMP-forming)/AMP-acid ligase II
MTETAGTLSLLQPPIAPEHVGSVGQPVAGTQVRICDDAGAPMPDGEVGEIWGRGAQVFLGYWNDEPATAAALTPDRWYRTGDFGRITDGFLFLESRRTDLIIRGGENIYPIEIENRLVEHPDIDEAAVVGIPHHELGQEVMAVVVVRAGAALDEDAVRSFVAETHARFKVPAVVRFRDELPRNETGKVHKRELARELA